MNIIHLEETGSTNDYAKKHISDLDNLTVIYADRQTNGRGRLERKWIDTGEENVYMSIVLKPFEEPNPIYPNFTQYLSVPKNADIASCIYEFSYSVLNSPPAE